MILTQNYAYQIRRKSDGLFALGRCPARFGKRGKLFNGSGPLKNHLRALMFDMMGDETDKLLEAYRDSEIISVAIVGAGETAPAMLPPIPVFDLVNEMRKKDRWELLQRQEKEAARLASKLTSDMEGIQPS